MTEIKIGTRGSALALKQAETVAQNLKNIYPELKTEFVIIKTTGDKIKDKPLYTIGGKGLFTNELEKYLKEGVIDIAVHSGKDLPSKTELPFTIGAVLKRGSPEDLLITKKSTDIYSMDYPLIGTSSPRRIALGKRYFSARFETLRGNVPTRLQKLKDGLYDAIIIAKAGPERLNINLEDIDLKCEVLNKYKFIPASCQAIIACQCIKNTEAEEMLKAINHSKTKILFDTERRLMEILGASCHDAAGIYSEIEKNKIKISAFFKSSEIIEFETEIDNIEPTLIKMAGEMKNE